MTHNENSAPAVELAVDRDGNVATVEMRRPPNNYFDQPMIAAIADALDELASKGCRAVVLASEGRHFCAGADFARRPATSDGPHLYETAIRLFEQPLPIVAAVQGAAIGGGLGLALAADLRVGCPEARFSANFAKLGFHPGFGLSATLPPVIGHQATLELMYTGRRIGGEEALALGLLDRLVSAEDLRRAAVELAAEIASSAPLAVRSIRKTMRGRLTMEVRELLKRERSEQERLMATDDFREGVQATAERRPPVFHGR